VVCLLAWRMRVSMMGVHACRAWHGLLASDIVCLDFGQKSIGTMYLPQNIYIVEIVDNSKMGDIWSSSPTRNCLGLDGPVEMARLRHRRGEVLRLWTRSSKVGSPTPQPSTTIPSIQIPQHSTDLNHHRRRHRPPTTDHLCHRSLPPPQSIPLSPA